MEFIQDCDIKKLNPYQRNPRHNDNAVDAVAASMKEYGFLSPVITDADFNVCVGHTRIKAATELGLTKIPVMVVPELVGDKFKGYNIADNQTATIAEWADDELGRLLSELQDTDLDMSSLGFGENELDVLSAGVPDFAPVGEDEQSRLDQIEPITCPNCGHTFRASDVKT